MKDVLNIPYTENKIPFGMWNTLQIKLWAVNGVPNCYFPVNQGVGWCELVLKRA